MNNLETRIAALEAKDEIRELTARYCHAVTDGDGLAIVDLFCTDGVFRMRHKIVTGRDEAQGLLRQRCGGQNAQTVYPKPRHRDRERLGSFRALLGGNSHRARWRGLHWCRSLHRPVRKENGKWRIADRHYNAYHFVRLKDGWNK